MIKKSVIHQLVLIQSSYLSGMFNFIYVSNEVNKSIFIES